MVCGWEFPREIPTLLEMLQMIQKHPPPTAVLQDIVSALLKILGFRKKIQDPSVLHCLVLQSFIKFPLSFLVSLSCNHAYAHDRKITRLGVPCWRIRVMFQHIEIPSETCSLIPLLARRLLESVACAQSHFQRYCSFKSDHDIARKFREFNIPPAPMTMQKDYW